MDIANAINENTQLKAGGFAEWEYFQTRTAPMIPIPSNKYTR